MKSFFLLLALSLAACSSQKTDTTRVHEHDRNGSAEATVSTKGHALRYLSMKDFPKDLLPPPPLVDSLVDKADITELTQREKIRTAKQCSEAMGQMQVGVENFFPHYPLHANAAAERLFENVRKDVHAVVESYKTAYQRPRPFTRKDHSFKACYDEKRSTSYPSGHATVSEVYARVLGELEPAHKDEYLKDAQQAALNRVIAGVHHPSDVKAGAQLGDMIFEKMKLSPAFQHDLAAVRESR